MSIRHVTVQTETRPETGAESGGPNQPDSGLRVLLRVVFLFIVVPVVLSYLAKLVWQ